ncbi:MAG: GNAT family N-acetyltransferase, partial [Candidatus Obscuribacterales bacterium]|nr:GNAT family N-acetyltransferase [Candidatus Obscuribacterales bacterium]
MKVCAGSQYKLRKATLADAATIAHQRASMFKDIGRIDESMLESHVDIITPYTRKELASEQYHAWLVELENELVAGGGVSIREYFPRPAYPLGVVEAYVLNVYTAPEHRRRGLAKRVMLAIIDWCRSREIHRISLHASTEGRMVYESLGFKQTDEM